MTAPMWIIGLGWRLAVQLHLHRRHHAGATLAGWCATHEHRHRQRQGTR